MLIAGDHYYPQAGTEDWIGCFNSYEEAIQNIKEVPHHVFFSKGKDKGKISDTQYSYEINNAKHDWYEIVDLEGWMK